ncbi:aspartate/glutamate racemase family protein [Actinoalloteichus hymeniacidonis]|uniref:Hydantoin racemase n=1 Tax=Actinoalloteichus hymeniacidonis TaxID=340345 RepID=A0AAC9HQX3_9PSEU|nr:aspartate/glutamate racemase family protein [Actinoalloteichus hymeniacidonis]AOS63937.1 hydantoin racemase [Actinoalloteichus hymeniacidonis]MBB5908006.1 Asp/Glu/hydantoin racemase [Actinoalloteichus hymeniacidonis]
MSNRPLLGIVRVLTTDDESLLTAHGRAIAEEHGLETRSICIPDQPHGVYDDASAALAIPKIVEAVRELVADGAGAVMISCAADPGLAESRAEVSVPVYGAGSTAASVAAAISTKVGVLGITEEAPASITSVLGDRMISHRQPTGVTKTTDLLTEAGQAAALRTAGELVSDGAEIVVFACTGLTSIDLAGAVRENWGVPVVDAVRATGAIAGLTAAPA